MAGLHNLLWWAELDYKSFKSAAMGELREVMREYSLSDSKDALRLLYQTLPGTPEHALNQNK